MKFVRLWCLSVALGLAVMTFSVSNAAAQERIGKRFVGTYVWFEDTFQRVVTITRLGNFSSVSQAASAFGFTDGLGAVIKSGSNQVTARQVNFNFEPDGTPKGVSRVLFVLNFADKSDGRFQSVGGTVFGETFAPDQNPLNPTEPPFETFNFTFEGGQRINVN